MKYVNIEECCSKVEESRIDRESKANVYLMADDSRMLVSFAYTDRINDETVLIEVKNYDKKNGEEIWQELLALSMFVENKYQIRRFVDDVRTEHIIQNKTDAIFTARKNGHTIMALHPYQKKLQEIGFPKVPSKKEDINV